MSNRIVWIDLIKVFAMLGVVFLHSAAPILYQIGKIDFSYWMIGNIYDSMVRMAVPLFFMVSGVLFLNYKKEEALSVFFKKRFLKVVIPLIVWSFIYILFKKYVLHQNIDVIKHMIYSLNRPEYFHLWFLYVILGIYLVLPILKVFTKFASKSILIYFLILWTLNVSIIPFINYFTRWDIHSYMPMMSGYIGYLVLGYQLSKINITKKLFYTALLFVIVGTMITVLGTWYLSEKAGKFVEFFYGYFSISTFIQAVSYFVVLKYIGENILSDQRYAKLSKMIASVSIASLGIYLIHPIYLFFLEKSGLTVLSENPAIMVPLVAILTFVLSFISIYIIQKIPIVKIIAP